MAVIERGRVLIAQDDTAVKDALTQVAVPQFVTGVLDYGQAMNTVLHRAEPVNTHPKRYIQIPGAGIGRLDFIQDFKIANGRIAA